MRTCIDHGLKSAPRGMDVRECEYPVTMVLADPHRPFMNSPMRRPNYRFGLAEAAWILSGSDDAQLIGKFNSQMLNYSDNGETMWGAYGPRLMGQLEHVVSTLKRDPDSRQALVTTWKPQVGPVAAGHMTGGPDTAYSDVMDRLKAAGLQTKRVMDGTVPKWDGSSWRSKDIPCTVAWHFTIRQGKLRLVVFMRSNDVWLGLPYDLVSFTTVQRVVASMLGLEPGPYAHIASNLHLYEQNMEAASASILDHDGDAPALPPFADLFFGLIPLGVQTTFKTCFNEKNGGGDLTHSGLQPYVNATLRDRFPDGEVQRFVKLVRGGQRYFDPSNKRS